MLAGCVCRTPTTPVRWEEESVPVEFCGEWEVQVLVVLAWASQWPFDGCYVMTDVILEKH